MKLSDEEKEIIINLRLNQDLNKKRKAFEIEAVRVSGEFLQWNCEEGYELTLSVFLDDFGAEDVIKKHFIKDLEKIYTAVKRIIVETQSVAELIKE